MLKLVSKCRFGSLHCLLALRQFGPVPSVLTDTILCVEGRVKPYLLTHSIGTAGISILLGGSVVRALDSGPRGRGFESRRLRFRATRSTQPSIPPG